MGCIKIGALFLLRSVVQGCPEGATRVIDPDRGGSGHCICDEGWFCAGPHCALSRMLEGLTPMLRRQLPPYASGFRLRSCTNGDCTCKLVGPGAIALGGVGEGLRLAMEGSFEHVAGASSAAVGEGFAGRAAPKFLVWASGVEGMGSWRWSLAEMLYLAKQSGRFLVLPCVRAGVLVPCWPTAGHRHGQMLPRPRRRLPSVREIGTYINVHLLQQRYTQALTWEEFEGRHGGARTVASGRRILCMHPRHPGQRECARLPAVRTLYGLLKEGSPEQKLASVHQLWNVSVEAILAGMGDVTTAVVVMYQRKAFRPSLMRLGLPAEFDFGVHLHLQYSQQAYARADAAVDAMDLAEDYVAFHWRSESSHCNYTYCASRLRDAIDTRLSLPVAATRSLLPARRSKCLLVSDIPAIPGMPLWRSFEDELAADADAVGRARDMRFALKSLGVFESIPGRHDLKQRHTHHLEAEPTPHCRKLDVYSNRSEDPGLLAIVDKILALRMCSLYCPVFAHLCAMFVQPTV